MKHMSQKMNHFEVSKFFYFNPSQSVGVRELARLLGISVSKSQRSISFLEKEGLVSRSKSHSYDVFEAKVDSSIYLARKKLFILEAVLLSPQLNDLNILLEPSLIILFGSCSDGYYTSESDIDIFVQSHSKKRFVGSILGLPINIYVDSDLKSIKKGLRENIVNGIVLKGKISL